MSTYCIIPARIGSTRLQDKPLRLISAKPLILHVLDHAKKIQGIDGVYIATDNAKIAGCVKEAGGEAIMTPSELASGTDRVACSARLIGCSSNDIIINIQGDQPFFDPDYARLLIEILEQNKNVSISTLACPIDFNEAKNPNRVKVILDKYNNALYFSRSVIPYVRDSNPSDLKYLRHIGVYGYRNDFLQTFTSLDKSFLEDMEKLEQLRALENGYKIGVGIVEQAPIDIDTEEDLLAANKDYKKFILS
jgi:3-deoxy-manno-octulosonate cytidylyltransferase (CMP-KDO synthetase)